MVNIKVAVRIRPLSHRELIQGDEIVIRKENKSVVIINPKIPERQDGDIRQRSRRFSVDFCYDPEDPDGCSQEAVYNEIGSEILDSMFEGYNACVLAYGHSASGKTYTIMGLQDDPGLTPRLCNGLFERVGDRGDDRAKRVEVRASFLEIYNEKVKDLLGKEETGSTYSSFSLRVREHPKLGPYVQGLSEHLVTNERALLGLLAAGNKRRSTATTENNIHSSRSHAVFIINFRQTDEEKCETEKWSKVYLVDLAGSLQDVSQQETTSDERATSTQSKERLQEGANINKSLVTLGNVISALAEGLETSFSQKELPASKTWQPFVPYRDSVLTWLLKDTLGGNSNTIMIIHKLSAQVNSHAVNDKCNIKYEWYAKRTKRIVNQAIVNEDPKVRTIRELRREIARLKGLLLSVRSVTTDGCDNKELWQKWIAEEGMSAGHSNGDKEREEHWGGSASRESVGGRSAALLSGPTVGVNDEKKSVVNGSTNDTFSHESQIFSDSLESLASVFVKKSGTSCDSENDAPGGTGRTEVGCAENLKEKDTSGMLHRSRPDLIKGISARFKEQRLPSTSSQSCTDVSNLSQSTSENSLNSSGSMEVQTLENRQLQDARSRSPPSRRLRERGAEERASPKNKHSRIVEAVTSRLYVAKKKPDHRVKVKEQKTGNEEAEELKLCKRARMKLFDLSRKMTLTRKVKKMVDDETQTDSVTGTIRVKEKSVETDLEAVFDDDIDRQSRITALREGGGQNLVGALRVAMPWALGRRESATQTTSEKRSDKSANTSPIECSPRDEEIFSDDSLDLEWQRKNFEIHKRPSVQENIDSNQSNMSGSRVTNVCCFKENKNQSVMSRKLEELVFNEFSLSNLQNANTGSEQRGFSRVVAHQSNISSGTGKEENLSSDSSFTSADGTEFLSSSEASSEDFVFYENPKETSGIGGTLLEASRSRELYTITENSEHSDHSDAFSPDHNQSYSLGVTERRWSDNSKYCLKAKGFDDDEIMVRCHPREKSVSNSSSRSEESISAAVQSENTGANGASSSGFDVSRERNGNGERPESFGTFSSKEGERRSGEQVAEMSRSRSSKVVFVENGKMEGGENVESSGAEAKKTNWADRQSNLEKQYLNLNICSSSKAPFSIDTHLFGKEWKKEQSFDIMFTSADSLTLVFMGPANPKSSVLMEIIKRSLDRRSSVETSSTQRMSKNRGVQCDGNLVRSVSVDTAMIALSKIARNQERSPNISRATSMGVLESYESLAVPARETGNMNPDFLKTQKKKSALKCSIGTETTFNNNAENIDRNQKKNEETERPKKSVSWSQETKCETETEFRPLKQTVDREPPMASSVSTATEEKKNNCWKAESAHVTDADDEKKTTGMEKTHDLTIFLKETIQLLKKINSSSSRLEMHAEENQWEVNTQKNAKESNIETVRRTKKSEPLMRSKAENIEGREEGEEMHTRSNGSCSNSTWPRRRATLRKPPTGMRGRFGRSVMGGRLESFHSGGLLERTSPDHRRSGSGGISGSSSKLTATLPFRDEVQSKPQGCHLSHDEKYKWNGEPYDLRPRSSVANVNFHSLLETEMDLENCCRRLEMAIERDEMREKVSLRRWARQEWEDHEVRVRFKRGHGENEFESYGQKATMQRRKGGCADECTCRLSARDPCKQFLIEGCQSTFELDSFGPGSNHCHQLCIFCRKKDTQQYFSALDLNSECPSDSCRLNYYGYCPCSSVRLTHVASSPRAYMRHLLTLRRRIVGLTTNARRDDCQGQLHAHALPHSSICRINSSLLTRTVSTSSQSSPTTFANEMPTERLLDIY